MRRGINRSFDEQEIWYLMWTGLVAIGCFERMGRGMGRVGPGNVLMNKRGHVRYVNRYSWPDDGIAVGEGVYLAPEEFQEFKYNPIKAECFGLGLTITQLALMNNMKELYNRKTGFNFLEFDQIRKRLLAQKSYSRFFIEVVMEMLDLDAHTRPSPSTILKWLGPYEKDILHFQSFSPRNRV